jgi:predicted alpha/beta hydrolase family esterase
MTNGKHQIIMIGGGDSFSDRADFLRYLETVELRDAPSDTEYKSWKAWLSAELGDGYWFDRPDMPNSHNAHYDEWKIWFERHAALVEEGVILIGHSLGAMFLAKYLSENEVPYRVKHLFLLAGPCGEYDDGNGNDCGSFRFPSVQLKNLSSQVQGVTIMHSEDDFVVPFSHAERFKEVVPHAELVRFTDKNHFIVPEFPELLERIRSVG